MNLLPYAEYFYKFADLPGDATAAKIRRSYPEGEARYHAFKLFADRHPQNITYLHGQLVSAMKRGLYCDEDVDACFDLVERGLALKDSKGTHAKLQKLKADLECQQLEMGKKPDDGEGWSDPSNPLVLFKIGNYAPIIQQYEELAAKVKPRGITGPPEEHRYWYLFQMMIKIALVQGSLRQALEYLDQYEQGRIAIKMTPLPEFDIPEAILGYLATNSIEQARAKLQFWLAHSRTPCVADVVVAHPDFADLING